MSDTIILRDVNVHNLQSVSLDIPKQKLIGFCGPSGSGKSSLAINTLYAEGQRRYLDTFSVSERGQLDQPEKPDASRLDGIPPTIAITRSAEPLSARATVGSVTELAFCYQTLFSQFASTVCPKCNREARRHDADSVSRWVLEHLAQRRVLIGFDWDCRTSLFPDVGVLLANGFVRCIVGNHVTRLEQVTDPENLIVLVDRIQVDPESTARLRDSIATAFQAGGESCLVLESLAADADPTEDPMVVRIGAESVRIHRFSDGLACPQCQDSFERMAANELSPNSPKGACPACDGLGFDIGFRPDKVLERSGRMIREELLGLLAEDVAAELQSAFDSLRAAGDDQSSDTDRNRAVAMMIERLNGLYENGNRSTRNRFEPFRGRVACPMCNGKRISLQAASHRIAGWTLVDLQFQSIGELREHLGELTADLGDEASWLVEQIQGRLDFLCEVGVGYLAPAREVSSLSTGERQRVGMTNALGSRLVNVLYVFDEPCSGLHPADVSRLVGALESLAERGNTVIAVDHDLELIRKANQIVEFGPGAGIYGGTITFCGSPDELRLQESGLTADYLSGRRKLGAHGERRSSRRGAIELKGACGNNLKSLTVRFPLGLLCVVTGVSGSGKSSLVVDTLYPAIASRIQRQPLDCLPFDDILGIGAIDDVVLVDQSPLGASSRSCPATYTKAFDAIRNVFAETLDARARNIKAGRFSFNTEGGRCDHCQGEGSRQIDMQFMANLHVKCRFCQGLRYKKEILNCRYRGLNVADVLNMTAREAFSFFRGKPKVQTRLKPLLDVGLDYLRLGQPASTLSSGEAQRLRLAGFLASGRKARTLFVLDEPTVGLHYSDVVKLLDCFDALIAEGHSLIVVEHNRMMMCAADHLIDLGPGPGSAGGQIVASGTPESVAGHPDSLTGRVLAEILDPQEKSNPASSS